MGLAKRKQQESYTYDDYVTWPDDERWEIIDGEAYAMTPAPVLRHQTISLTLSYFVKDHFRGKPCKPFFAPTDVVFDETNVVQPDLLVVCDPHKTSNEKNIQGAPDLVVEVLSPSTRLKDRREKKLLYERFSVREYWIVYPDDELVERFTLVNGQFISAIFNWNETLPSSAFPELRIPLWEVFEKDEPTEVSHG